ncbi:MAG: gamma-glutamylcyclotransferase [Hyphomicrobium sp.]
MWVFSYGSLMWNPGFATMAQSVARLDGYHRALCIRSTHYRGTRQRPGLVFGLDRGGVCDGVAFEVAREQTGRVLAALRQRELIYGVYREVRVAVTLIAPHRRVVEAVAYIAERAHPSYAGPGPATRQAEVVRGASGCAGTNLAYLANTLAHMRDLGLRDRPIERIGLLAASYALHSQQIGSREPPRITSLSAAWRGKQRRLKRLRHSDQSRFQHRAKLGRRAAVPAREIETGGNAPPDAEIF